MGPRARSDGDGGAWSHSGSAGGGGRNHQGGWSTAANGRLFIRRPSTRMLIWYTPGCGSIASAGSGTREGDVIGRWRNGPGGGGSPTTMRPSTAGKTG